MARRVTTLSNQQGSVFIVIALTLVLMLSFAALAVDIGYAMAEKAGLRTVAEAAALAGARELGSIYEGLTSAQQASYQLTSANYSAIEAAAQDIASKNPVLGQSIEILAADIQVGQWDFQTRSFTSTSTLPNAVRVTARKDSTSNGSLTFFLAQVMGISSLNLKATNTAALGSVGTVTPGALNNPFAISQAWFQTNSCSDQITFNPTGSSCAGWHTFEETPSNASTLKTIIDGLTNDTFQSPATIAGRTQYEFIGGDVSGAFNDLQDLYNAKKDANGNWKTFVPVYAGSDCSNPSGLLTIVGFATAIVTQVTGPPDKTIQASIQCNVIETGTSGGPDFGTSASVPALVEGS